MICHPLQCSVIADSEWVYLQSAYVGRTWNSADDSSSRAFSVPCVMASAAVRATQTSPLSPRSMLRRSPASAFVQWAGSSSKLGSRPCIVCAPMGTCLVPSLPVRPAANVLLCHCCLVHPQPCYADGQTVAQYIARLQGWVLCCQQREALCCAAMRRDVLPARPCCAVLPARPCCAVLPAKPCGLCCHLSRDALCCQLSRAASKACCAVLPAAS
jgi:hypothetical protein